MRRLHARVQPLEHRQHQATRPAAARREEALPDDTLTVILVRYDEPLTAGEPT
jgi:hypothetical protein